MSRVVVGGRPELVIDHRPEVADRAYRYRAHLRGRSAGGYLTAFGDSPIAAARALIGRYEQEVGAVREGIVALERLTAAEDDEERCGAWMPLARERCARRPGHRDNHKSRYAMENDLRRHVERAVR